MLVKLEASHTPMEVEAYPGYRYCVGSLKNGANPCRFDDVTC